jgi:hypothetical protein
MATLCIMVVRIAVAEDIPVCMLHNKVDFDGG